MTKKVADIRKARKAKQKNAGCSVTKIKKRVDQERRLYKKLTNKEPDALASGGDMSKILEEPCDDDEDNDPTPSRS